MAGRISWGLADQAVSSLTNFAVGVCVARSLGLVEFGIFSLAWVTYSVVLNVSRGLATDPLVVRFSGVTTDLWRGAVTRASGTALAVGCVAGLVSVLGGIAIGGGLGWAFIALGLVLPALTLQDSWRFAFFADGVGRQAFGNDVVWAVALVPAMMLAADIGSVPAFILGWGVSAGFAAIFGAFQTGLRPSVPAARGWLHDQRALSVRYMVENVSISGAAQVRMYGLGAIAGVAAVGVVRGSELLLGPFVAVMIGLASVAVAEAARVLRRSTRRLGQFCLVLGGVQAAGALAWGLLLLLLPDAAGRFALGEVWTSASALIVPATLGVTGACFVTGATTGVRALGAARRSLRAQLIASVLFVSGGLAGAIVAGALGSAWGVAVAVWVAAAVWWSQLLVGLREHETEALERSEP